MTALSDWTRDRRPLDGLSGEELAEELAWQALEDAAARESVWTGPKVPREPWHYSPASLSKPSRAEQRELDLRPLVFAPSPLGRHAEEDGSYGRRCDKHWPDKTRAAINAEYIKSAEAGRAVVVATAAPSAERAA